MVLLVELYSDAFYGRDALIEYSSPILRGPCDLRSDETTEASIAGSYRYGSVPLDLLHCVNIAVIVRPTVPGIRVSSQEGLLNLLESLEGLHLRENIAFVLESTIIHSEIDVVALIEGGRDAGVGLFRVSLDHLLVERQAEGEGRTHADNRFDEYVSAQGQRNVLAECEAETDSLHVELPIGLDFRIWFE